MIQEFKKNIESWIKYWLENTIYGVLSREIYKMSSRSRLTQYPKNLSTLSYERRRKQMEPIGDIGFNQFWGNNNIYKLHNLYEHFQFSEYDNLLGAKVDDILGSFTRANFQPMLNINSEDPILPLASEILDELKNFFERDSENKNSIIQCFDNQLACGYGAMKLNHKIYSSETTSAGEIPKYKLFLESCPYPELCFFNPYSTSTTKTDSFYDDPLSFCGQNIKMSKRTLKEKYPEKFRGVDPISLGFENQKNMPLYNYVIDRRSDLILCAEYYDYVDGRCRYTFFCSNAIMEQYMIDIDFLPMIFVAGNASYVNNIQQIYSIFDKFLPIQKAINHLNQMLLENSFSCKASTIFFTNTASTDNLYKSFVENFTKYNVIMLPMTTRGAEEQIPPMNLQQVELPMSLMELRNQYLLYLEESLRGSFDHDESGFGQSGRALQIKQTIKSNLFAKQIGNLTLALSKFCEFYKKMYFSIRKANGIDFDRDDGQPNFMDMFPDFSSYRQVVDRFNFDILIDPDRSITKEANLQWIANAMPLVQSNPVLAEEMFYLLLGESELPNKAQLKVNIQNRLAEEKKRQEEMAKQPTPMEIIQDKEIESDRDTQLRKIDADFHKQAMKDATATLNTILKGEIDQEIAQTKIDEAKLKKISVNDEA
jgi:hypothetical protein